MAAPVSHIIYAKKYLENHPMPKSEKDLFLLGCVFPDIRRIDENVSRSETHQVFFPINLDFAGLSPFEAGWKFHLFCDMKREELLRNEKFYSLKKDAGEKWLHPAKHLEDQLLYEEYNNWEKIVGYFNNPPKVKLRVNVSQASFELWYAILAKYFEKKPDEKSIHAFLIKQHSLPDKVDTIIENMRKIEENKRAVEILKKISQEIIPE